MAGPVAPTGKAIVHWIGCINAIKKSDHSLIQISFFLDNEWVRGRGFYKFNVKLLEDKTYVDAMNNKLDSLFSLREDFTDKSLWWDFVKMKIRGFSISYSSFKAKESRYKEQKIANELKELENKLDETPTVEAIEKYTELQNTLNELYIGRAKGSLIRSRAQHLELNEKNNKYFLNLEKRNFNAKCIKSLKTSDGFIYKEQEILEEGKRYFENLYSSNHPKIDPSELSELEQEFLSNPNIKKLDNSQK